MKQLVCLGGAALDRVFKVDPLPSVPGKSVASSFVERGGGMAATAAVAIAALGGFASFWGRVGEDPAGAAILAQLARCDVDIGNVLSVPGGQSATSAVFIDSAGERNIVNFPGELAESAEWVPLEHLKNAKVVLADVRWAEGAVVVFEHARSLGIPTVLDADSGDPEITRRILPLTDHAIFSAQGLRDVTGTEKAEKGLAQMARCGSSVIGVTLGAEGSMWMIDGNLRKEPACHVPVINTIGSGDVFHGAYALALAEGQDVWSTIRFATAAAAIKCTTTSGWEGMPRREQVERLIAEHAIRNVDG